MRRVLLQDFKALYISTLDWIILLGGGSAYADYIIYTTGGLVFSYQMYFEFFAGVAIISIFVFVLGLYTGVFFDGGYKDPIQKIKKISLAGHSGFLLYTSLLFFMGLASWKTCLFYSFAALFFVVLLTGAKIGHKITP
ncbi:MAG: hypothetical protein PVF58_07010 [Candidatus Methanofastidiosia archaeon]